MDEMICLAAALEINKATRGSDRAARVSAADGDCCRPMLVLSLPGSRVRIFSCSDTLAQRIHSHSIHPNLASRTSCLEHLFTLGLMQHC